MYRILKFLPEALIFLAVFISCDMPGMKKYLLIAGLSLILLFLSRKKRWSADALCCVALPAAVYLFLGTFQTMICGNVYSSAIKIVVFWVIPLIFAFALYLFYGNDMKRITDMEFLCACMAYTVINWRFLVKTWNVESTFAFVFGAFFIYYVYQKRWTFCGLSALFIYFSDKRIVVMAILPAVAILGILWLFRQDRRLAAIFWGLLMAAVGGYVWLIRSGALQYFCRGIGINTNGRVKMYSQITEWFDELPLLFGNGIGVVEKLLEAWKIPAFANLHNDLLKFYIELGAIGLLIFLLSYGIVFFWVEKKFGKEKMSLFLALAVYTMLLYATDNVSIYILYLIPVYSILFTVLLPERAKEEKR